MSPLTAPLHALSFAALLSTTTLAFSQTATPAPAPAPAKAPEYVTDRAFKSKVFVVQRSPSQLREILKPLLSGFLGAQIASSDNEGLKTLSVRDFPENLASIEEAIKRLDTASTPRNEVEFHIHVLFAFKAQGPSEGFPEELKDVLSTLKSTLQYKSYTLAASFVQRATAGSYNLRGMGDTAISSATPKGSANSDGLKFRWNIDNLQMESPMEGPTNLKLNAFELHATERIGANYNDIASIRTHLNIKDGEKAVVGTSVLKDRGLIVVLTAKVLK